MHRPSSPVTGETSQLRTADCARPRRGLLSTGLQFDYRGSVVSGESVWVCWRMKSMVMPIASRLFDYIGSVRLLHMHAVNLRATHGQGFAPLLQRRR
jgi:hypothetical protein